MIKCKKDLLIGIIAILAAALALFTIFCDFWEIYNALTDYDDVLVDDSCWVSYNKLLHRAFVTVCSVDENGTVVIPDEVNGCKVVALGGDPGCGMKHDFFVMTEHPSGVEMGTNSPVSDYPDSDYETVVINVKFGNNIKKIDSIRGHMLLLGEMITVDGIETRDVISRFVYSFEVKPENKTFYAEDGKLYYK